MKFSLPFSFRGDRMKTRQRKCSQLIYTCWSSSNICVCIIWIGMCWIRYDCCLHLPFNYFSFFFCFFPFFAFVPIFHMLVVILLPLLYLKRTLKVWWLLAYVRQKKKLYARRMRKLPREISWCSHWCLSAVQLRRVKDISFNAWRSEKIFGNIIWKYFYFLRHSNVTLPSSILAPAQQRKIMYLHQIMEIEFVFIKQRKIWLLLWSQRKRRNE